MQFYFPDVEDMPLPARHRFPGDKYRKLRETVERTGILSRAMLAASPPATRSELERAHDPAYVEAVVTGTLDALALRRIGLPWSETLVRRSLAAVGGSLAAARRALQDGLSGQLAGGTHHAHRGFGSGFCVFNDLAVASLVLLDEGLVQRVAIVDLDVHQGDGNAAILADDPRVLVLSIHGEKNFPFRKVASTIDIGLPDATGDADYLRALGEVLPAVEAFRPNSILYLSGADPLAADKLGRLSLTLDGLARRDRAVMELARRLGVPLSIAVGGGYAEPIEATVAGYAQTFAIALEVLGKR